MCQPHSRAEGDKMNYMDLLVCFCCCFGVGFFCIYFCFIGFCLFIFKVFVFSDLFSRTLSEIKLLGKLGRLWDLREGKEYVQNILSKKLKIII